MVQRDFISLQAEEYKRAPTAIRYMFTRDRVHAGTSTNSVISPVNTESEGRGSVNARHYHVKNASS